MRHMVSQFLTQSAQMVTLFFIWLFYIWVELRNKRKKKGLTIETAAESLGVDPSTFARWERGTQKPHPKHRQLLMEKFQLNDDGKLKYDDSYEDDEAYEDTFPWVLDEYLPPSYWND